MQTASRKQTQSIEDKIIAEIERLPNIRKSWSEFEDSILKKYYPTKGSSIGKALNRSRQAVSRRAAILGISFK